MTPGSVICFTRKQPLSDKEKIKLQIKTLFGFFCNAVVMKAKFVFILPFVLLSVELTQGLRCYTCSYSDTDKESSELCVTEPWNLAGNPIRTCLTHFKFCIIVRVESKETGKVTSFLRKCEETPMEDSDIDSMTVVTHYRSCTTDLCNKGDGLNFIDEGHEEESVAILVPDRSFSAAAAPVIGLVLIPAIISAFPCF